MADVSFENVSFIYNKGTSYEVKALDDVSLTFPDRCITALTFIFMRHSRWPITLRPM